MVFKAKTLGEITKEVSTDGEEVQILSCEALQCLEVMEVRKNHQRRLKRNRH